LSSLALLTIEIRQFERRRFLQGPAPFAPLRTDAHRPPAALGTCPERSEGTAPHRLCCRDNL